MMIIIIMNDSFVPTNLLLHLFLEMKIKRVLYTQEWNEQIRLQLRITNFNRLTSTDSKKQIYTIYFDSEEDAEYAMKKCRRMRNITIKPYQMMMKLNERHLPKNAIEVQQLQESLQTCLQSMHSLGETFHTIQQRTTNADHHRSIEQALLDRLYAQHSTAFYLKMALIKQLQVAHSTHLHLQWPMIASQIHCLQQHVQYEQFFQKSMEMKNLLSFFKPIQFESSITMSSKLAYTLTKLSDSSS